MSELNTRVRMMVRSANITSVPVDDTLSIEGQAADAAAVGAALAEKADVSQVTGISVNGESADAQGKILIDGGDIPVSGTDTRKIDTAIEALESMTAEDIPMSDETGAQTIAEAVNGSIARNGDSIPLESGSETMVTDAIEDLQGDVEDLQGDVETIQGWTAADLPYVASGDSVKKKIDDLGTAVTGIQGWTAADLPYASGETASVKDRIDGISVNGQTADENGNIEISTVPLADDLTTEDNVTVDAPFMVRTAGGRASISTGSAWIRRLKGNSVHMGYVPGVRTMDVKSDDISAEITWATFISEVGEDTEITFTYNSGWEADGSSVTIGDYGIAVTGSPTNGDEIHVKYVEEVRGEILPASPEELVATGWNLFNSAVGYARVAAYEGRYKVGGTYSTIRFAETPEGTSSAVVVDGNGLFEVEKDGFILLTGGNATNTYIICCWSDWEGGYPGDFQAYTENGIDLTTVMSSLPYGLCSVGNVFDEINFNTKLIIRRIDRVAYSEEARAAAESSGRAYDFDEDYIYQEMTAQEIAAATSSFALEDQYDADEHGIEFINGTDVPVGTEIAYGASLKDKLRRDVLTISQQTLNENQQEQVRENIGAASAAEVSAMAGKLMEIRKIEVTMPSSSTAAFRPGTIDQLLGTTGRTYENTILLSAMWRNKTNGSWYLNLPGTMLQDNTLRMSVTESAYFGEKAKIIFGLLPM